MAFRKFFCTTILLILWIGIREAAQAQEASSIQTSSLGSAFAIDLSHPGSATKAHHLDQLFQRLYQENQFNGTVAILHEGHLIYHQAFGWANFEERDTLTLDTPFRLASVSKQFTAMAIMMLREEGKLHYDDLITQYLPTLPYTQVKIRHLLHHNSGIPDYFGIGWSILKNFPKGKLINNEDLIEYFSKKKPPLQFKPEHKASYSNTGYAFLASIVEKVSGQSFPQFLHERIFSPLDMKNTFIYNSQNFETITRTDTSLVSVDTTLVNYNEIKIETNFKVETRIKTVKKRRAYGYQLNYPYPQGYQLLDYHAFDGIAGEKSVCASSQDLIKWDRALHEHRLVSANTLREAFSPHAVTNKKDYKYGFGWKIYTKDALKTILGTEKIESRKDLKHGEQWLSENQIVFHHGLYRGFRNYIQRDLKTKNTVIVLSNRTLGGKMFPIVDAINAILKGTNFKYPKPTRLEKNTLPVFKEKFQVNYNR